MLGLDRAVWVDVEQLAVEQRYQIIGGVIVLAIISTALGAWCRNPLHPEEVVVFQHWIGTPAGARHGILDQGACH